MESPCLVGVSTAYAVRPIPIISFVLIEESQLVKVGSFDQSKESGRTLLPVELRRLVRWSVTLLGAAIEHQHGRAIYQKVENLRKEMKLQRGRPMDGFQHLHAVYGQMAKWNSEERFTIAHSYAVMLELMNSCENAYRTYRLSQKDPESRPLRMQAVTYVMTAHPTEARSPEILAVFQRIQLVLVARLHGRQVPDSDLHYLLVLALQIPMARQHKPTVADEAEHIYWLFFKEGISQTLLDLRTQNHLEINFRTWVGGDKDGHPGVNERVMVQSLSLSRQRLVGIYLTYLAELEADLHLLKAGASHGAHLLAVRELVSRFHRLLVTLRAVKQNDGKKLTSLHQLVARLGDSFIKNLGSEPQALIRIKALLQMFPGLVVPLEIREDSREVKKALLSRSEKLPIACMLATLKQIAGGGQCDWYVCGFVLSMTQSVEDLRFGVELTERELGEVLIPVIPLFESEKALLEGAQILRRWLAKARQRKIVRQNWQNKVEIMVGYSDSAKENGALASRFMIERSLHEIDEVLRSYGITPIFFHGSGGSIARGGGSLEEQISWWPKSALFRYKATLQGEMVQRTLSSPELITSQILKIALQTGKKEGQRGAPAFSFALDDFVKRAQAAYRSELESALLLRAVESATPYPFLDVLRIGSRPSKRSGRVEVDNLRAIPWVLCWTQTRVLFPVWWGMGAAWHAAQKNERKGLRRAFLHDAMFGSFIKLLGFTLAKVELPIWRMYLSLSSLSEPEQEELFAQFCAEYKKSLRFVREVSGERNLLWFRPWLGESVRLRSSMIHPLNLLQILALKSGDERLLRETVTGIASGLLTTG